MEIKNLFDNIVKEELIERINRLTPETERKWGKMNVAQMLAHLQMQIEVAYGTRIVKGNLLMKLMVPLFKKASITKNPGRVVCQQINHLLLLASQKILKLRKINF